MISTFVSQYTENMGNSQNIEGNPFFKITLVALLYNFFFLRDDIGACG